MGCLVGLNQAIDSVSTAKGNKMLGFVTNIKSRDI